MFIIGCRAVLVKRRPSRVVVPFALEKPGYTRRNRVSGPELSGCATGARKNWTTAAARRDKGGRAAGRCRVIRTAARVMRPAPAYCDPRRSHKHLFGP